MTDNLSQDARLERIDANLEWMRHELFGNGNKGRIQELEDTQKEQGLKQASWDGALKLIGWLGVVFGGVLLATVITVVHHILTSVP